MINILSHINNIFSASPNGSLQQNETAVYDFINKNSLEQKKTLVNLSYAAKVNLLNNAIKTQNPNKPALQEKLGLSIQLIIENLADDFSKADSIEKENLLKILPGGLKTLLLRGLRTLYISKFESREIQSELQNLAQDIQNVSKLRLKELYEDNTNVPGLKNDQDLDKAYTILAFIKESYGAGALSNFDLKTDQKLIPILSTNVNQIDSQSLTPEGISVTGKLWGCVDFAKYFQILAGLLDLHSKYLSAISTDWIKAYNQDPKKNQTPKGHAVNLLSDGKTIIDGTRYFELPNKKNINLIEEMQKKNILLAIEAGPKETAHYSTSFMISNKKITRHFFIYYSGDNAPFKNEDESRTTEQNIAGGYLKNNQ